MKRSTLLVAILLIIVGGIKGQSVSYLTPQPLKNSVSTSLQPVRSSSTINVPIITWGGDIATIYAKEADIFKKQGLNVSIFREDNFKTQVEKCLKGETPYLRGTMGMINAAGEVFKDKGSELIVIYQLTWSVGGDAMVVRDGKSLKNIKTVALQLYGPHMDYAANLFNSAGRLNSVSFKWLPELTLPPTGNSTRIVDPVSAFQVDTKIDATMCIIPDALMLTSNGGTGTGAEGSVKGAKILLSTKTAGRIISDVYAVRKDYFEANKSKVMAFVKSLMLAEEQMRGLSKTSTQYRNLMSKSADIFFGAPQATADAEALLGDCEFVGHSGNVAFFTGQGTTRTFSKLNSEIQTSFTALKLINSKYTLKHANWDYNALASGLTNTGKVTEAPKFDKKKVTTKIEEEISVEPTKWEEEGTLFVIEINFEPNQSDFTIEKYKADFEKALNIAQTYSGALIVVEGHSDPLGILKAQQNGEASQVINAKKQEAKNLSYQRSQSVLKSFSDYAKSKGIKVDNSQFIAIGMGINSPKYNPPRTEAEWKANRRVVFRIKQVEAELEEFVPLD